MQTYEDTKAQVLAIRGLGDKVSDADVVDQFLYPFCLSMGYRPATFASAESSRTNLMITNRENNSIVLCPTENVEIVFFSNGDFNLDDQNKNSIIYVSFDNRSKFKIYVSRFGQMILYKEIVFDDSDKDRKAFQFISDFVQFKRDDTSEEIEKSFRKLMITVDIMISQNDDDKDLRLIKYILDDKLKNADKKLILYLMDVITEDFDIRDASVKAEVANLIFQKLKIATEHDKPYRVVSDKAQANKEETTTNAKKAFNSMEDIFKVNQTNDKPLAQNVQQDDEPESKGFEGF